ncbi:MAG: hypothetical protein FWG31_03640 [Oscillospiraceae bacterium]|nr:hypothetical protein [Oscillospiraceae bacterium]
MDTKGKIKASDFGFDISILPEELVAYADNISKTRKGQICKEFASPHDHVALFYGLRFQEQLSNTEIARLLNKGHSRINHVMEIYGWEFSFDYNKNKKLYEEECSRLERLRQEGFEQIKSLDVSQYPQLLEILNDPAKVKMVKKIVKSGTCGPTFTDHEDLITQLYFFYVIREMPRKHLFRMFGWYNTAQGWLKALGLRRNPIDGARVKKDNRVQDYAASFMEGNMTRLESQRKNGNVLSSKNENYFRNFVANEIYNHFNKNVYDIGVCCKSVMFNAKEIDVPVLIFNVNTERLHRFAAEYNGPHHTEDGDSEKIRYIEQRGWIYIPVKDEQAYSEKETSLRQRSRSFCKDLAARVRELESR